MKQVLLLILLLCCTLTGKASTEIVLESDSLIKVLETLPYDTTRLNVLNQIIRIEQNTQQCIQYSDALMKEALQLGNDKYAALSAYYDILYYYNRNNHFLFLHHCILYFLGTTFPSTTFTSSNGASTFSLKSYST